jgi:hypothetical protein
MKMSGQAKFEELLAEGRGLTPQERLAKMPPFEELADSLGRKVYLVESSPTRLSIVSVKQRKIHTQRISLMELNEDLPDDAALVGRSYDRVSRSALFVFEHPKWKLQAQT